VCYILNSENFKDILLNYEDEMDISKSESEFVSKIEDEYCDDLKSSIHSIVDEPEDYKVSIHTGRKNWLNVPFAIIFNLNAGDSYRTGLFLGYSFYPKSNRLYVKLDQGCKGLAGNMDLLFIRGEKLRTYLDDVPEEFKFNPRKCAAGNIVGKEYKLDEISDESLNEDLKYLIDTYEYLMPYYEKVIQIPTNTLIESLKSE